MFGLFSKRAKVESSIGQNTNPAIGSHSVGFMHLANMLSESVPKHEVRLAALEHKVRQLEAESIALRNKLADLTSTNIKK